MKVYLWLSCLLLLLIACDGDKKEIFYSLTVDVEPSAAGKVEYTSGPYKEGQQVVLIAEAKEGYVFSGWTGTVNSEHNPLSLTMNSDYRIVASFEKKTYDLTIRKEGEGIVREKVVTNARLNSSYPHGTVVQLTAEAAEGWYFEKWEGDLEGNENPTELVVDAPRTVKAIFKEDVPVDIIWESRLKDFYVSESRLLNPKVIYKSGKEETPDPTQFTATPIGGIGKCVVEAWQVRAVKSGATGIMVYYKDFSKPILFNISAIQDVPDFDTFLKTPAEGASLIVPVVVINFLPTEDGFNLDMNWAPDNYFELQNSRIWEARNRIEGELKITKFGIEEGTRYRQFARQEKVNPYVGIKVIKYFNVYEMKMKGYRHDPSTLTPDYHDLFAKLGMEDLVNNQGVKEVWITMFNKDNFPSVVNSPYNDRSTYYGIPESNMSSPLTGDISNSYRDPDDLPIYKKTYVVYGNSGHRGADTNLHNRGHQIEVQLRHLEEVRNPSARDGRLFWNHYVGVPLGGTWNPYGRVGMTHFPPNTREDYDYDNPTWVNSDIQNWDPAGGEFSLVNNQLWKSRNYNFNMVNTYYTREVPHRNDYTNHAEVKWLIFWWQTIPGPDHGLTYQGKPLTNWWDVFYNWDDVIKASGDLTARKAGDSESHGSDWYVCSHNDLPPYKR